MTADTPILSLCMIVRDAAATIQPCLQSIRPWVDEMIVVDTGSLDATEDLVQELGGRLFHFPWVDDFAAARNASLEHARGQWIFWMDADDTIDERNGAALQQLVRGTSDEATLGYVLQVHCPATDDPAQIGTVVDHIKVFRNRPDLRFEGRIHEQILPSIRRAGGEVQWTDLFVVHSGHDTSPAGQRRKLQRDLRLLKLDLADRPDHPFVLFNLGMTLADAGNYSEAVAALERCLQISSPNESHVRKAFALLASSQQQLAQPDAARHTVGQGLRLFPEDAELLFRGASLAQLRGDHATSERMYLRILEQPRDRHFASVDPGIFGHRTRQNLAHLYVASGQLEQAEHQWRWLLEHFPGHPAALQGLGEVLLRRGRFAEAQTLAEKMLSQSQPVAAAEVLLAKVQQARGNPTAAIAILEESHQNCPDSVDVADELCRLLIESGQAERAIPVLQRIVELAPSGAAWHNLGAAQMQIGQLDAARQSLDRSLQLRPDAPHTRHLLTQLSGRDERG